MVLPAKYQHVSMIIVCLLAYSTDDGIQLKGTTVVVDIFCFNGPVANDEVANKHTFICFPIIYEFYATFSGF